MASAAGWDASIVHIPNKKMNYMQMIPPLLVAMILITALVCAAMAARHVPKQFTYNEGDQMTPWELDILRKGQCPDCGHKPLTKGPQGGVSMNVLCERCLGKFNLHGWEVGLFAADRLTDRQKHLRVLELKIQERRKS